MTVTETLPEVPTQVPGELSVRTYGSLIGGRVVDGTSWVYTVDAGALLEDVFTAVTLKRDLERGDADGAVRHPYVVGRCAVASMADVDDAIAVAASATEQWSRADLDTRLRAGRIFRDKVLDRHDELVDLMVAEGHPRSLAKWEVSCLLSVFSEISIDWYRELMHTERFLQGRRLIVRRMADGVVCVNPPQNAPAPSSALALLSAMAGNAVVIRAPRSIALSTMFLVHELMAPALAEVGAPVGTINVLCGTPGAMIDRWVEHPDVDDILYFGGSEAGLAFHERCLSHGKKAVLELAGNDSLVVWRDADLESAAEAVTESFFGSGQICMVPNRVIVHPAVADDFIAAVERQVGFVRPGHPGEEGVLLSPVRRSERFFRLLDQATGRGASVVCGGHRMELDGSRSETGVFLEPTVLRVDGFETAAEVDAVTEETFFPLIPIIVPRMAPNGSDDQLLEDVLALVNSNRYGLRNSFWSSSDVIVDRAVTALGNGGLLKVNDSHVGFLPFLPTHGGTGLTGGVHGEANYPILSTSHLQGVSVSQGHRPRTAVFGDHSPFHDLTPEKKD